MDRLPNLRIHRRISAETIDYIVLKVMEVRPGPTFAVVRRGDGDCELWMSKRTHDALEEILRAAKTAGEF